MTFLDLKIHMAVLKIAVDAASCVAHLTEHQRKFSGQYFFISLNLTVTLQVFLYFKTEVFLIE